MEQKVKFRAESSLAQQCYEQLQQEIIEGSLKPGQKLKVEPIKERFGIGQSPIREALSRLAAFGLVEVEDNKGFRVATISEADIRDVYATFTLVENSALALAIERGDDAWAAGIVGELYKLSLVEKRQEPISYAVWAERNYNFHVALIAGCNSPALLEVRHALYMKFDRYCRMSYQLIRQDLSVNYADHKKLADAVLAREASKAQAMMVHHINEPLEEVIKKLQENKLM